MKKILILGLFVSVANISFASDRLIDSRETQTETQKELILEDDADKKPCKYSASVRDKSGNRLVKEGEAVEGKPVYASDCGLFFSKWLSDLEEQGYRIDKSTSTWE